MTNKHLYLLGIVAVIAIGTYLYLNLCSVCLDQMPTKDTPIKAAAQSPEGGTPTLYPFAMSDGNFSLQLDDNFNFHHSSPTFLMPISTELKAGIEQLKNHLANHSELELTLIGHHSDQEENNTPFPDLGTARAHSVKNHFIISGIPEEQLSVLGKSDSNMVQHNGIFHGIISYALVTRKETEKESINP
nr:hypothetical protein [Allomuricauda sp.]